MQSDIEAVIFDLGGVVIDIDFQRVLDAWQSEAGKAIELTPRDLASFDVYHRHERGEIGFENFYRELNQRFDMGLSRSQFEYGWDQIFIGPMPGVENVLMELSTQADLYAFSNTNTTHEKSWRQRYPRLISHFKAIFTSVQLSQRKPEIRAYHSVIEALPYSPTHILMLDDHQENVVAAQQAGLNSAQVRSQADILAALSQFGLVKPGLTTS